MPELWKKFISRQDKNKKIKLLSVVDRIFQHNWGDLDITAMKGYPDTYRCRVGDIRIVFASKGEQVDILAIDYRGDIYKNL